MIRRAIALFAISSVVVGQTPARKSPDESGLGRKSFNELLRSHDNAIMASMNDNHVFACFRPNKDDFFYAVFNGPTPWGWEPKTPNSATLQAPEMVVFDEYRQGTLAENGLGLTVIGYWEKTKGADYVSFSGDKAKGSGNADDHGSIFIDRSEFTVEETYLDNANEKVAFRFSMRLSTGRFVESYTASQADGGTRTVSDEGRCTIFAKGRVRMSGSID